MWVIRLRTVVADTESAPSTNIDLKSVKDRVRKRAAGARAGAVGNAEGVGCEWEDRSVAKR